MAEFIFLPLSLVFFYFLGQAVHFALLSFTAALFLFEFRSRSLFQKIRFLDFFVLRASRSLRFAVVHCCPFLLEFCFRSLFQKIRFLDFFVLRASRSLRFAVVHCCPFFTRVSLSLTLSKNPLYLLDLFIFKLNGRFSSED